jgi:hypothetical protein
MFFQTDQGEPFGLIFMPQPVGAARKGGVEWGPGPGPELGRGDPDSLGRGDPGAARQGRPRNPTRIQAFTKVDQEAPPWHVPGMVRGWPFKGCSPRSAEKPHPPSTYSVRQANHAAESGAGIACPVSAVSGTGTVRRNPSQANIFRMVRPRLPKFLWIYVQYTPGGARAPSFCLS